MAENAIELDDLVRTHQGGLLRYATQVLWPDREAARDVVQETFVRWLKVQRNGRSGQIEDPARWLFRVAHNLCRDVQRRMGRRRKTRNDLLDDPTFSDAAASEPTQADAVFTTHETHRIALQEIQRLPEEQKQLILLRFMENMTLKQISDITGIKIGTVHYRLGQGLTALATQLRDRGIDGA